MAAWLLTNWQPSKVTLEPVSWRKARAPPLLAKFEVKFVLETPTEEVPVIWMAAPDCWIVQPEMTLPVTVKNESSTLTQELALECPFVKVVEVTETVAASAR